MNVDTPVLAEKKPMGRFHGTGGELFVIWLVNGILTGITFGIYAPWARAKLYRYFYANTEFAGHRFRFTGTGKEMFIGMLKAIGVFFLLGLVLAILMPLALKLGGKWAQVPVFGVFYLLMGLIAHYALFGAMRYRLSRARYREISFRLEGDAWAFAREGLGRILLGVLTLGICLPLYRHFIIHRIYNNIRFGNLLFGWDAKASDYWKLSLKGMILTPLTLGVYYFFWYPKMWAFVRQHLSLGGNRFQGDVRPGEYAKLVFGNLGLAVITVGIATPWILVRTLNFFITKLELENAALLDTAISAGLQKTAAGAEAVADAMDMGVGIGF